MEMGRGAVRGDAARGDPLSALPEAGLPGDARFRSPGQMRALSLHISCGGGTAVVRTLNDKIHS